MEVYRRLANREKKEENKNILQKISMQENNHYNLLKEKTGEDVDATAGRRSPVPLRPAAAGRRVRLARPAALGRAGEPQVCAPDDGPVAGGPRPRAHRRRDQ